MKKSGNLLNDPRVYIYIYIHKHTEMVDFGKSDKMIKTSGIVDKPTLTTNSAMIFLSLFKKELLQNLFLNKEQNIVSESVGNVGLPTFPHIFIIYIFFGLKNKKFRNSISKYLFLNKNIYFVQLVYFILNSHTLSPHSLDIHSLYLIIYVCVSGKTVSKSDSVGIWKNAGSSEDDFIL